MWRGEMLARGSVCGRILWLPWQSLQVAATMSPFLKSPSPWMLWL